MTKQAQQVPGQPLTAVQVAAGRVRFNLTEQHLVQSLQCLVLHRALRVHHCWHHTLQPRLLHHKALWFSLSSEKTENAFQNVFSPSFFLWSQDCLASHQHVKILLHIRFFLLLLQEKNIYIMVDQNLDTAGDNVTIQCPISFTYFEIFQQSNLIG